ncbi:MAG: C39 family peptidase [Sphingopyxis sp.]|uniref:C39 family peptidase n=1 Tax=Sphingopyxis sp. TaxID=1908224 RepID=UPI001A28FC92|nr:C39 family peptidase [Sphingopyxis sp.]MBJ7498626.1 C39 family peptidase [Sphingopyxis sp.]
MRPMRAPIAGFLCALAAAPAAAEVRLTGPETGSSYQLQVMTWWDIPFRSVIRQRYDFSCGSAAIATLLTYHYGAPTSETMPFRAMWEKGDREAIRKVGFSMLDMKTYLASRGYRAEGFRLTVEQLKQVKRPTIVLMNLKGFKHFVVIKGVRGDRVLTGDSVLGLNEYSLEDFGKHWNGIALAIVEGGRGRPEFNLAGDWGPWSQAPLEEDGSLRVAVGDLTTNLPPQYQLSPQILLDVRVGTVK